MTQTRIRPCRKQKHDFFFLWHPNLPFSPLKSTKILYPTPETGIFIICREAAFLMFIYLFIYYFLSYPSTLSPRFCIFSFAQAFERKKKLKRLSYGVSQLQICSVIEALRLLNLTLLVYFIKKNYSGRRKRW